jgi:hypothetical protein
MVWFWHLGLKPQDVFLASYPRSGSTWLRFMLFEILSGEDPGFRKLEHRLPEIQWHRGAPSILPQGGRLIKTHEKYRKEYTRAAFLVRDPRDVFLSGYARAVEEGLAPLVSNGDLDSFLVSFFQGRAFQMGSWHEHSLSWLESPLAKNGNLLVMRYEDLRRNSEQELRRLLEFLGVTPDIHIIRRAIENNTLKEMRTKEDKERNAGQLSVLLHSAKSTGEEGRFVRKGSIGGWRNKLTDTQLRIIDEYAGDVLTALSYEPGVADGLRSLRPVSATSI